MVSKIGTKKTQVLHRMWLRQFTPPQPVPDIQTTPLEWKSDREVIFKHDDLYTRAWECGYESPILDSDYNKMVQPKSPEIAIQSGEAANEMRSTP